MGNSNLKTYHLNNLDVSFLCKGKFQTDLEIQAQILSRLEQDPKLTLQAVMGECKQIISMRQDLAKIGKEKKKLHMLITVKKTVKKNKK